MGYRLSKIFTRSGDKGSTGLGDGSKTKKFSDRIVALGTIDELNSMIGLMLTENLPPKINKILTVIQHHLFNLGGEISMPGHKILQKNDEECGRSGRGSGFPGSANGDGTAIPF